MTETPPTPNLNEPDPARRPARLALYAGGVLIVLGLIALYLGYDGAAKNSIPQAQTPYIISGGLVGLGLIALGGIAIALSVILQVQGDFRGELGQLRESLERMADSMTYATHGITSPAPSKNGHVMVAAGASTFHRAECRLVAAGEHVRPMAREEADRTGLTPCRICKP